MAIRGGAAVEDEDGSEDLVIPGLDDTNQTEAHTPPPAPAPEDDVDVLLAKLEAVKDKIPAEKLGFLDRKFQPAFNTKLNLLNQRADNIARDLAEKTGYQLPEGKSGLDLLSDGQEFVKFFDSKLDEKLQPVMQQVEAQKLYQTVNDMAALAQTEFPEVRNNMDEVARRIRGDNDLLLLSQAYGGKALPMVMRGVGQAIELEKATQKIAELTKALDAAKVAQKTGRQTSRAGGAAPGGDGAAKAGLRNIIASKLAEMEAGE